MRDLVIEKVLWTWLSSLPLLQMIQIRLFFHFQFIVKHIIHCEELLCPVCSTMFYGDGQLDFPCFDIMLFPAESTDKNKVLKMVGEE